MVTVSEHVFVYETECPISLLVCRHAASVSVNVPGLGLAVHLDHKANAALQHEFLMRIRVVTSDQKLAHALLHASLQAWWKIMTHTAPTYITATLEHVLHAQPG